MLSALRKAFAGIALASAAINILALTGSFFMLQVYDRVIPSRSLPTLSGLVIIVAVLFLFQGIIEFLRSMLLVRIGMSLDERLNKKVFRSLLFLPTRKQTSDDGLQSVRDLEQIRSFLSGNGSTALFDLPWVPFYLILCFLFHFWIGFTALCGALLLVGITVLAELLSRRPAEAAAKSSAMRLGFAQAARRNWEAAIAMGFVGRLSEKWAAMNGDYLRHQLAASTIVGALTIAAKMARMMLQSGVLAVGAILVIRQEATGGIIIASSILVTRALAPVELAIGQWKGLVAARQGWVRLAALLDVVPPEQQAFALPPPSRELSVENISVTSPGSRDLILRNISFRISSGTVLGVIGPSASGKSSLARAIAGLWPVPLGAVRLDRAALSQWNSDELGRHIGYLPQDVDLFDGSIAENISRFAEEVDTKPIIAAAKAAGVYDMIVKLPDGFDTRIGESGSRLSAGQRQRIALARALYNDPFLVVLDEPNSNLDAEGEAALTEALAGVRKRGAIAIVIAHRPSALAAADTVMIVAGGQVQAFGPKKDILGPSPKQVGTTHFAVAGGETHG
ncbi:MULTISPECIES: type I secretion system permease/ATPase [unclassified Rhizobium]|uniref:type I secretion system permease/ATPase n=1 Tax=unclassified Rhizobium TaxID=2613769 RepID=UPI0017C81AB7|nr:MULTISPECIES: type I secretion system permease/ATPase [unclassified Rhizobium]MBB3289337.1 PrtD family type I secretion system ABC transporter [Rhizobium sp. BK252]MBB3404263.1 PrtD family type I secretion system ABC transporter [Rhizobium sp. BK289]MBB3416664.1 PrtD family type I secretion system ABC transporter [Rhizobium sp. BK284]MBB3484542.1 PrtD family type I secretion system ABC transporter [Rhizobium sp. BK347]MDK4721119.1 type I secretion system permease/ATPase [Rhizobium sp. CNPSo